MLLWGFVESQVDFRRKSEFFWNLFKNMRVILQGNHIEVFGNIKN